MIYKATHRDISIVAQMALIMWSSHRLEDLEEEFKAMMNSDTAAVFIIKNEEEPIGFAQCQLRYDYVEETKSSPVGYLEGIFVKQQHRNKGYAKELLKHCEKWALEKGCVEFASDCEITNDTSLKFHLSMGFKEANRIICFTKRL